VNHSVDGNPVHVAQRLDQAGLLLEGQVDTEIWYRVRGAKLLSCGGRTDEARSEIREMMSLLDAELEASDNE
jgi:hypothetical protein